MKPGRNLTALLAAIFLIASAEELWGRFVPTYLGALGATIGAIALYGTLKDLLDALYQFPGGLITARLGHKGAFALFNVLAIAGYAVFALAQHWWVLFLGLPLVMAWQSFSLPATFSLIGDSLPHGQRTMAFAYQSIVRRIPIVVAPIVGGTIIAGYGILSGMRLAIVIGLGLAVLALCLQLARYDAAAPVRSSMRELLRDVASLRPKLRALLLADVVVRFGQGIGEIFVVLYVVNVLGMSTAAFGWFVGIAMATSLVAYVPAARLADAHGRTPWIALSYAFFAGFPLVLALSHSLVMVLIAFVAMGLREIGEPARKATIVDLARVERKSVDVGAYYLVRGLAVFPASLVGAALWRYAPHAAFLGAAAVAALGMTIFIFQERAAFRPA